MCRSSNSVLSRATSDLKCSCRTLYWPSTMSDRSTSDPTGNFQGLGVLLIWVLLGKGPTVLAVGAAGGCLKISPSPIISLFSSLSLADGPI